VLSPVVLRRHGEILLAESSCVSYSLDGHLAYIFHYSVVWIFNWVATHLVKAEVFLNFMSIKVNEKVNILSLFTHPHVVLNLYDFFFFRGGKKKKNAFCFPQTSQGFHKLQVEYSWGRVNDTMCFWLHNPFNDSLCFVWDLGLVVILSFRCNFVLILNTHHTINSGSVKN